MSIDLNAASDRFKSRMACPKCDGRKTVRVLGAGVEYEEHPCPECQGGLPKLASLPHSERAARIATAASVESVLKSARYSSVPEVAAAAQSKLAFCESSHNELLDQFRSWCEMREVFCLMANPTKKSTIKKGAWDCHCFRGKNICIIEFKIPPDKLSEDQIRYQAQLVLREVPHAICGDLKSAIEFVQANLPVQTDLHI